VYDRGKIITGVVVALILLTLPLAYLAASGDGGYVPELQSAAYGDECIESEEFMRENHMTLLDGWRNTVVRGGLIRQAMDRNITWVLLAPVIPSYCVSRQTCLLELAFHVT